MNTAAWPEGQPGARAGFRRVKEFMEKQAHNIQDVFLNHLRKEKLVVTIFLMSGVKLTGRIKSFDKFAVILESNHRDQLVFKHAIATVVTTKSAATGSAPPPLPTEAPSQATKASRPKPSS